MAIIMSNRLLDQYRTNQPVNTFQNNALLQNNPFIQNQNNIQKIYQMQQIRKMQLMQQMQQNIKQMTKQLLTPIEVKESNKETLDKFNKEKVSREKVKHEINNTPYKAIIKNDDY